DPLGLSISPASASDAPPAMYTLSLHDALPISEEVGTVKYSGAGLRAGGALNKDLGKIGDIGIMGVVAARCGDNLSALMSAPYSRSEEHTSELQSRFDLVCRLLLEKTKHTE